MIDSEEIHICNIVDKHIEQMLKELVRDGPSLGEWPRDTGAITTIVVEVLKHQYRTSEDHE